MEYTSSYPLRKISLHLLRVYLIFSIINSMLGKYQSLHRISLRHNG